MEGLSGDAGRYESKAGAEDIHCEVEGRSDVTIRSDGMPAAIGVIGSQWCGGRSIILAEV
jgi:hypothetical protein